MHVAELGEAGQVGGASVVLVQQAYPVVLHPQRRVADRAVGRRGQRLDHDLQAAVEFVHLVGDGLEERGEPALAQLVLQLARRVLGEQDGGPLVDEALEMGRVEVVPVQVGDVEVVGVAQALPVEQRVVGEREPGREVGRVHPRVTQDAAGRCVDTQAGMAGTGDPHAPTVQDTLDGDFAGSRGKNDFCS